MRLLKNQEKKIDSGLFLACLFTCLLGLVFVFEASSVSAARTFGDQYHFLKDQTIWLGLGFISLSFFSFFDYHRLYYFALPIIGAIIILLLLVFLPGLGVKALGAHRWLNFGPIVLQPAEFTKLGLTIYLAAWFSVKERGRFWAFLILIGIIVGLVVLEPDLGTAIIISLTAICLYFVSGAPLWHFAILAPLFTAGGFFLAIFSPYRFRRLTSFINPDLDPLGASYHIRQVLLALGSGGLFGVGLGKSLEKFDYLPEATTDSIFAIIGEEIGFFGASMIILLFLFILWRGIKIAKFAPDRFGFLLAYGICSWIGLQAMVNLGAMVALIPLTGVPLPFISYGGSNLIATLTGVGILLNISKQRLAKRV